MTTHRIDSTQHAAQRGVSLLETTLAMSVLAIALMVGVPMLASIGDAGADGAARVTAQSDNGEALARIAAELQNTSATAFDEAGGWRFEVLDGDAPQPLRDVRDGDMGGFRGQLGEYLDATRGDDVVTTPSDGGPGGPLSLAFSWTDLPIYFQDATPPPDADPAPPDEEPAPAPDADPAPPEDADPGPAPTPTGGSWPRHGFGSDTPVDEFSGEYTFRRHGSRPPHAGSGGSGGGGTGSPGASGGSEGSGSGARGGTTGRSAGLTGATVSASDTALRPRRKAIPLNSVLRFQKVVDFGLDPAGQPAIVWSTPIEYRVVDRKLVRIQDGETRVVAPNIVAFRTELTDAGTLALTLVSQKKSAATGRITFQANQIEVSPKN